MISVRMLLAGLAAALGAAGARHDGPLDRQFTFVQTTKAARARGLRYLETCRAETSAFAALLATIPDSLPLLVSAVDRSPDFDFGGSYDTRSLEPRFTIVFRGLDLLPTVRAVRRWEPDSSWAFTRCEALAHELAETIAYRNTWQARPGGETFRQARAGFTTRLHRAHREALQREAAIAVEQRTRIDTAGQAYARSRDCFVNGVVLVVFGPHTEALVYEDGALARLRYYPNTELCPAP